MKIKKCWISVKSRLVDNGFVKNVIFIKSSAENAKLEENQYTLATIAFGFRNFTDHSKALKNIYNSLRPGGRLSNYGVFNS